MRLLGWDSAGGTDRVPVGGGVDGMKVVAEDVYEAMIAPLESCL